MRKNSTKFFAVVLAIAMLATQFVMPAFAVAETYYCNECGNTGVKGKLLHEIDPTCGADGYEIWSCVAKNAGKTCTGTITLPVARLDYHNSDDVLVKAVDPTCTEAGTKAHETCVDCGGYLDPDSEALIDIVIPATGHDYEAVVTDPNCTEDGYTTYTCSVCGDTYTDDTVPCTGHTYETVPGQAATCKEPGWTEYEACACGAINPEKPKTEIPVEDHNLHLVGTQAPDCTTNGYNDFKCDEPTCPYYNTIREVLPKLGHSYVSHAAKKATCTEMGYAAYRTCAREGCDYSTYNKASEVAPLGHTHVETGYIAPTCTTAGTTNAIVCDRCDLVHHEGEVIPATGHNLYNVSEKAATCTAAGNIAYKKCRTCSKNFATSVANEDIDATPLKTVTVNKLGHDYETITIAPTCVEGGYKVFTCKRDNCDHTYSEAIAAAGHKFEEVAKVEPKCGITGMLAHNKCTVCELLFAIDADPADITIAPVEEDDLVIEGLEHVPEVVDFEKPTYNKDGNAAGTECSLCGAPLNGAEYLAELDEAVKFHYVIEGVNGADTAVNSGYVVLKIYFDVLKDVDDLEEYESDVLANIFAVDFALDYDKDAFELTYVEVAPGAFTKAEFTPLEIANANGNVAISQDMVTKAKEFRGENNLFATLTFQVATDAAAADYTFANTALNVVHPDAAATDPDVLENVDASASDAGVTITVKALGDANEDTIFTSNDTLAISAYIQNATLDTEYVAEYDMDKDGDIDFIDLDLLRKAIVGNNEYLTITVDPNAIVVPEV